MMQMGVRWVYQAVKGRNQARVEAGQKPSLCFKGRQYMLCVGAAHPVRVFKRPAKDFDVLRRVSRADGKEYDAREAATKLMQIAARNGITVGAQKLLQRALDGVSEIDESQFNDEEELTTMETVTDGDTSPEAQATALGDAAANAAETAKPKRERKPKAAKAVSEKQPKEKAAKPAKAAKVPKEPKAKKAPSTKGPSRISQAVEWMREQVKKKGGQGKLERGELKEMYVKGAEKFGLSTITMSIQYGKQVRTK